MNRLFQFVRSAVVSAIEQRWGQPDPKPTTGRPIWDLVIEDMRARDRFGREKYGVPLQAFNGREVDVDIYEEMLDLVVYFRQRIEERFLGEPVDFAWAPVLRVRTSDLAALLNENARLSARVDELLTNATKAVEERRAWDVNRQVRAFFVMAEQKIGERPHVPDDTTVRFRLRLVAEEFVELLRATFDDSKSRLAGVVSMEPNLIADVERTLKTIVNHAVIDVDLPELADACADLDYVNAGVRVSFGIDGAPIAKLVHDANMAKASGPRRESDGKKMKPPGWQPPDIEGELQRQGWTGGAKREVLAAVMTADRPTIEGLVYTEPQVRSLASDLLINSPTLGWGTLLESYVTDVEQEGIPKGTWVVKVRPDDETWAKIKSGQTTGFSIGPRFPVVEPKAVQS